MSTRQNRRELIKTGLAAAAAAALGTIRTASPASPPESSGNAIPRWRGFNLMPFFSALAEDSQYGDQAVEDRELQWIRDWGFDYVRLPVDYWFFVLGNWRETQRMDPGDIRTIDEAALERLDRIVEQCGEYGLHLTINMHRAPGYCINGWEREPFNLFKDADAEDAFAFFWELIASRYGSVSARQLSFNLVNEAPELGEMMSAADYRRVMLRGERLIHGISPDRTVIIDGTGVGRDVVTNMIEEPVAQAFHAYDPFRLTHFKASWVDDNADWPIPSWPYLNEDGSVTGPEQLALQLAPWAELARQGVGVHCGEFGAYRHTPHAVVLSWLEVVLEWLKTNGVGYALWNFRGSFGVLDSGRTDVDYEDWNGMALDRGLLELLRKY